MLDKDMLRVLALGFTLSSEIVGLTMVGLAFGYGVDRYLQWSRYPTAAALAIMGMITGFYRAYKSYERYSNNTKD